MPNRTNVIQDVEQIQDDLTRGYEALGKVTNSITIFGSARTLADDQYYTQAYKLAKLLGENGFSIITGGGGGIMQAANKGAFECTAVDSIGLNIKLPKEQTLNPFTTMDVEFQHFYARKYMLVHFAKAIVVFPGGFGTLDELFEVIVLVQTKKIKPIKIFLYSKEFWHNMMQTIESRLMDEYYIGKNDLNIIEISDDIEYINNNII
ncbi:MAG: TIGR00730 family Rossman fold protein [Campylobacterota bacterium]|nr:TIGR00730 family Rossman fold protein [Campylobacterota bacterium]